MSIVRKGRGRAQKSLDLIQAMHDAAELAQPITGRGVGYKMFVAGLITSMSRNNMQTIYRLLKEAREECVIPWEWIVDETRELEQVATWKDPEAYARCVARSYRRDFWQLQPRRVEVWSEKGTVRGVLQPVLDEYAIGFRVMHGYNSATGVHDVAIGGGDGRKLVALYVGDYDPSGMYMSEKDLPARLTGYGGYHCKVKRVALKKAQLRRLPSFPATDKADDNLYPWFTENYADRCWEIDAQDPNALRDCVRKEIVKLIEPVAWGRCELINAAEKESLKTVLQSWGKQ